MKRTASAARKSLAPDVYQIVTDRITALLSAGVVPWRKGWTTTGVPRNLVSGKPTGESMSGSSSAPGLLPPTGSPTSRPRSAGGTSGRARRAAWQFSGNSSSAKATAASRADHPRPGSRPDAPLLRYYTVFNVEQCDGLTDVPTPEAKTHEHEPIADAEAIWKPGRTSPA